MLVLPFAVAWVRARESEIHHNGLALSDGESDVAVAAGVRDVRRVRVLAVQRMPTPLPGWTHAVAERMGVLASNIAGMTFGHGIALRKDCMGETSLLAHELAHVAQYERLGGAAGFLRLYLRECLSPGYPHGELEREARAAETLLHGCVNVRR